MNGKISTQNQPMNRFQLRKVIKEEGHKGKCPFPGEWIITVIWFTIIVGKGWPESD